MNIQKRAVQVLLIIILTVLPYLNILPNQYAYDDNAFILEWQETKSLENTPLLLQGEVPKGHQGVYRPLRGVFYALSYKLWGADPIGYHVQAILVHLLTTLVIYLIVIQMTKKNLLAFFTAVLFGTHPVHTEAISFTTASFDTIGLLFAFLSFYFYLKANSGGKRIIYHLASILYMTLAFFTYEVTLIIPLLIVSYDVICKKLLLQALAKKLRLYSFYFIPLLIYIYIRFFVVHIISRADYIIGWDFFIAAFVANFEIYSKYLFLLLFPKDLTIIHNVTNYLFQFFIKLDDIQNLIVGLLQVIVIFVILLIAFKVRKKNPLISFGTTWFFISVLIVSNIIPQGALMAERYLYLASFGFSLISAYFLYRLIMLKNRKYLSLVLFLIITLAYSWRTFQRNQNWANNITLWTAAVKTYPKCVICHDALAVAYAKDGNLDKATQEFKSSLLINPSDAPTHLNLGIVYGEKGWKEEAINQFKEALSINPNYAEAYHFIGVTYYKQNQFAEATQEFKKALGKKPTYVDAHFYLASSYEKTGNIQEAIKEYLEVIKINPKNTNSRINLGVIYTNKGDLKLALKNYLEVLEIDPKDPRVHYHLGLVYDQLGKIDLAIREYQNAIVLNPGLDEAFNNLGIDLGKAGQFKQAVQQFQAAISLKSDKAGYHFNLGLALEKIGQNKDATIEYQKGLAIEFNQEISNKLQSLLSKK
ncbi:tetratricopeptide repeat protein [Candidatus Daviesbacteria bacterium]|nr:tetratricopeptide repeat protein [Candidatus Daviesbacteria bacterium]